MKKVALLALVAVVGLAFGQVREFPILPINSWYSTIPLTGKNIVYDPVSNIAEVAYIPSPYDAHTLYWAYSNNDGNTWNEMGPLDWGYGAGYPAMAMDGTHTPYIIFNDRIDHGPGENRALCFIRDDSYATGLWTTPLIISDTIFYSMRFGSIDVDPSGDTIVIVAQGNYTRNDTTIHDILFTKSTDGGTFFDPMVVIINGDDFPTESDDGNVAECPGIHLGENGNIFVEALAKDIVLYPGQEWQKIYTASTNLGASWTDAAVLPGIEGRTYAENWWARLFYGVARDGMVYTGVGLAKAGENRLVGYRYRFSTDEFEEYGPIAAAPSGDMFGEAACATFACDAAGNIYAAYQDKDSLGFDKNPGYNIFVIGSSDEGHYWTYPLRIGSGLKRTMAPEMAPIVGDSGLVMYEPLGWWEGFEDSLRLIKFCSDSVFAVHRTLPMVWNVTAYGNTYDEVGPYVIQVSVKDNEAGFSVDLIYSLGKDSTVIPMVNVGGDVYEAGIPGQPIDSKIEYWVKIEDTDANEVMVPGSFDAGYSILVLPGGVVAYDDGIAIDGLNEPWENGFISVMISPTEAAVETLTTVRLFIWSNPDTFIIHLNPDDGSGKPDYETDLITPIEAVAPDSGEWFDVDIVAKDVFVPVEDFHVRIEFPLHVRPYIGADKMCDCDRSWLNYDGWWWAHPSDWGVGDLLIRAIMPGYGIGIEEGRTIVYRLSQNRPNPMLKATTIEFAIPKKEYVNLTVYNVAGQRVKTLIDNEISPGSYTANWNGRDENGRRLSAGVYFYRIETGNYISTRKLVLLR